MNTISFVQTKTENCWVFSKAHDAYLFGISSKEKRAELFLETPQKETLKITVDNVSKLRASDFLKGNVVFDILVFNHNSVPEDVVRHLLKYEGIEKIEEITSFKNDMMKNEQHILHLSSSYGCELSILFHGKITDILVN